MTPYQIKRRLQEKGLTQVDLAKRFDVSAVTIHGLVMGKFKSRKLERRLARTLGVKLAELRDGKNTR